jgi:heme A synthase
VFLASLATLFFLLVEAFIGAVLVKKQLVAGDASVSRAVVIALHLTNTMLLTASAATTAWWAMPGGNRRRLPAPHGLLAAALAALVLTNMSGAVTALGDTLFPIQPAFGGDLLAKVRSDLSASHHFLVRLRILHPVIALAAAALVLGVFWRLLRSDSRPLFRWGASLVAAEIVLGVLNVWLAAPGWMQILHLLAAQALWIAVWLTTLEVWPAPASLAVDRSS